MGEVMLLRSGLLCACAAAALLSRPDLAAAQTASPGAAGQPNPDQGAVTGLVVTASRVERAGYLAPTPVTSIGSAAIQQVAPTVIADALEQIPSFRASSSPTNPPSGAIAATAGQNLVDLRGLGAVNQQGPVAPRTLVLLDGQRIAPSNPVGTVDTNIIPASLIDRVDVVTGGASAAWGSDALAGVVNFVLNERLNGIRATAQYGQSRYGDDREKYLSIGAGAPFLGGRGHVIAGFDFSDNHGVPPMYKRPWGAEEWGLVAFGNNPRPAGLPSQGFLPRVELATFTPGGIIVSGPLRGIAFGPGGTPFTFPYPPQNGAQSGVYSTQMIGSLANFGDNLQGNWVLEAPVKRYTGLARASFSPSDRATFSLEFLYAHTGTNSHISYPQWPGLIVNSGNPFLPPSIQSAMTAGGLTSITVGRLGVDVNAGEHGFNTNDTYRFVASGRGEIAGDWKWSAYFQYGASENFNRMPGMPLPANLFAGTQVVVGPNGQPVCAPIATNPNLNNTPNSNANRLNVQGGQAACVPVNIFGFGSPSQAALNYITGTQWDDYINSQYAAEVNVQGTLFNTWAGATTLVLGADWRREKLSTKSDPLSLTSAWYLGNIQPYRGSDRVYEFYGEAAVPLAKDAPFMHAFDLNAAVRYTNYSTSGGVATWKLGATYEPVDGFRFRGTVSRDIAAPTLQNLFAKGTSALLSGINPINGVSGSIPTLTTGNPNLLPERAITWTYGVAFQPKVSWLRRFSGSIDYYKIDDQDAILPAAAADILSGCAAGNQAYCSRITFNNTALGIGNVLVTPLNATSLKTSGVDINVNYAVPIEAVGVPGRFNINVLATYVHDLIVKSPTAAPIDRAGSGTQGGVPHWTWRANFVYNLDALSLRATVHGFSSMVYDPTLIGPDNPSYSPTLSNSINKNVFPATAYLNLGVEYTRNISGYDVQLFATGDNVLNKAPPGGAFIAFSRGGQNYDTLGTVFKVGVRLKR